MNKKKVLNIIKEERHKRFEDRLYYLAVGLKYIFIMILIASLFYYSYDIGYGVGHSNGAIEESERVFNFTHSTECGEEVVFSNKDFVSYTFKRIDCISAANLENYKNFNNIESLQGGNE